MDAPRLDNKTKFVARPLLLLAKDEERLVLIVKASFVGVRGESTLELSLWAKRRGIRGADVP